MAINPKIVADLKPLFLDDKVLQTCSVVEILYSTAAYIIFTIFFVKPF
jgi:hypothetical protein